MGCSAARLGRVISHRKHSCCRGTSSMVSICVNPTNPVTLRLPSAQPIMTDVLQRQDYLQNTPKGWWIGTSRMGQQWFRMFFHTRITFGTPQKVGGLACDKKWCWNCCRKVFQNRSAVVQNVSPTLGIPLEQPRFLQHGHHK